MTELCDRVLEQLAQEPEIVSRDIAVSAVDGVVTLTGFTHTYAEKFAAERAAKRVWGVLGVANDIEVRLGTQRTDPELARDAVQELQTNISVPDQRIMVSVRDGVVTLEGCVDCEFQRDSALACVRALPGVKDIHSLIRVTTVQ